MSRLVNLSDAVYDELTRIKRARNGSYSEVIAELLERNKSARKTISWKEMIANQIERDKKYRGKKEKIDHDLILYGVSRDGA